MSKKKKRALERELNKQMMHKYNDIVNAWKNVDNTVEELINDFWDTIHEKAISDVGHSFQEKSDATDD